MIFDNLKTIFSQLSFLAPHEDDNEAVKIEWHDSSYVSVCFYLINFPSRRSRHVFMNVIPDWQIYPLIKLILNYLGIEYQKFYDAKIAVNDTSLDLTLILNPQANSEMSTLTDEQSNDIFARTIPTPLTDAEVIKERNAWTDFTRRYTEQYSFSYITPQDAIRVEPISWTSAADAAASTLVNDVLDPLP